MDLAALGFSLDTRPLEKGKKHLEELAEAAGKAEGAAEDLGKSNRKAGEDAKRYGQDTKSAAEETERLAREQQKASEATRGLSGLLGGLAISFSGLMIARDAVNAIAEFSKEVATLKATIGGTAEQMSALREQAKLVGSSTSFSLAEVAKAQRVLAQAGLEAQDILRATPDVLKFAQAGDFKNLEDAAELLVDVSSQTGKTAKDFKQLSDVMVATADTSTTSAQQLAFGYKYSATLAKEMGTEFKETSAALALLTNNGIKGESAGTALRGMMMSLLNPTNEAEKLFKKLGFNLNELNPAANGLIPVLSKLQEKAISMPDLAALFGTEAATAASILTKQYDKLGGMIAKIGDSAGITDRKSKVMSDNLKDAIASIGSAAEAAAIEISDRIGFEEFAENASQNISGVIGELSGLNDKAREAGTLAEEQAQKYADMGNALKAAGVIAGGFVALQLPAIFAATATAITSAAVATKGFTLALASNPFGLAAVAITTLTAAAIYYQDEIVSVGDTTTTVGDAIMATWEETGGVVLQTAADILSYFSDAMSGVSASSESSTSAIQTVWYYTGGAIIEAIKMAVNYALNAFPAMQIQAEATANAISAAFMRAAQFDFSGAAKAFTDATGKGNADAVARLKQDNFAILTTNIAQNLERKKGVALAEKEVQSELKRLKASQEAFATTKKNNETKKGPTGRTDIGEDKKSKKAADEAKKLAAEQEKLNNLLQKGSGFSASYAESLALLAKHQDKIPVEEYRAAVERLILSETDAGKAAKKHAEELAKLQEQFANDDAKRTQDLQWQSEELALQASLIGKTSTEQAYLVAAFEAEKEIRYQIIDLTQEQAKYEREGNKWAVDAIDERIAKLQDEAQARKDAAGTLAAQKAVLSGWQSVSSDIERALTDSLMRGFENGENFVDSLKNYIENAFKSFAVTLLLQPVMAPINAIGGPIYSQMMGGQPQQGQQQGGGSLNNLLSGFTSNSTGQTLSSMATSAGRLFGYNTAPLAAETASMFVDGSQAIYGFTDAAATAAQSMGVLEGSISSIATNASATPNWGYGLAGIGGGFAGGFIGDEVFGGKGYASSGGSMGGSIGTSLALASGAGPLGIAAGLLGGSLLGGGLGSLFGDREPDMRKAKFGYGASDALREEGLRTGWTGSSVFGQFRTYDDKWFSDSEMRPAMSAFVDSLESLDNAVADSLKLTADQTTNAIDALKAIDKEYSFGLQWGDFTQNSKAREQIAIDRYSTILDSVESGWGDFVRGFTGSFDQFPAFLQSIIQAMQQFRDAGGDVTRVFGQQVNSIKEFEQFAKSGETSAAAFQRLYGVFQITNRVLESLGKSTKGANLATADLRENFVRLAGGMEQLQGYLTEYYEGFYTETERTAVVMADLQKEFDKYGATVPATREEWRKLMESLDLSTDFGQQAAVKLYQLQGAFLSITPEIEETKDAVDAAADAIERMKDKAKELEDYFTNYLSGADYSGMTEQGREAASALDELVAKMGELAEAGGNTQLALDALNRYMSREIPRLYDSITKPFRDMLQQQQGRTDVGKQIYGIFEQVVSATKAINEVARAQTTAISKSLSAQLKSIDKLAETTNFVEQTFGGIVTDASGNATVIGESGATLGKQFGGDVSTNANLAEEVVSKYDATFGDIRKWFDEKSVFEQSAGKEALTEVFNQAQQTTTEQLSNIYEKIAGKEAESLGEVVNQYAQDVNLSNKNLSDAVKDSILSTDLLSKADPVNDLTKMAFGREATAEERQAVTDAYNWGVNNGKALGDIVTDIVSHVSKLEEAQTHLGAAALEAAKDVGDFDKALENSTMVNKDLSNYSTYDSAGNLIQEGNAEQVPLISEAEAAALREQAERDARDAAQKALEAKIKALEEVTAGFVAGVASTLRDSFAGIIAQSKTIGMSDIAQQAVAAKNTMDDVFGSVVESVAATVAGLNALGVTSATDAAKELMDKFEQGAIKTADELKSAVDAVFESVNKIDGTAAIKQTLKDASDAAKAIFDDTAKQLREQLVSPWQSAFDALTGNSIDAEINAAIKAKDQALADAKTLAESLGQNFDDLAKEIQRGFNAQLFGLTKQKLQGVIDSISKITDFQGSIDDAIFGLRVGMSGADVSGLYAQRQADIKAQLDAAMQGDNLNEQIGLANKLRETITQRYAAEQQAQERMMSFARGLGDYLRQLRTSDKSTGSIYDRLTEAQKQFAEDVALSRGAGAEAEAARGRITNTSDTLLDLARQYYASGSGYQDIYGQVVSGLEGLQIDTRSEAEKALSAAQEGNAIAEKQIAELQALRGTFDGKLGVLQQQQATYIVEMQKLAVQLELSQSAILQALKDLPSGISGAIAAGIMPTPSVGGASGANGNSQTQKTALQKAQEAYAAGKLTGAMLADVKAELGTASVIAVMKEVKAPLDGSHKDGLSHVPFDGYVAELHKGERVLTASENRDYSADVSRIMGGNYGGQSVAPLLNEIKALRQEVAQLRQQQSKEHQDDLRQREAIATQSAQLSGSMTRTIQRTVTLNI